jgi:pimeloyl-ACP methyl ester carboxylesterase
MRRTIVLLSTMSLTLLMALSSCGVSSQESNSPGQESNSAANVAPNVIEGRFDVGDYKLYMRCEGTGSPTVVYLHGHIQEPPGGAESARKIPSLLRDEHRICVYDRPNLGKSDDVPGLGTGKQTVTDLHRLLSEAGVEPPYVLLGASFGGMVAHSYAATYPDEVVGMVLLDAMIPGLLDLEYLWPKEERLKNWDWSQYEDKVDMYDFSVYAERKCKVPDIPMTYLQAMPITNGSALGGGPPGWEEPAQVQLRLYAKSFSPGVIKPAKSEHYMEWDIPKRVAKEVDLLIASISEEGTAHDGKASK